MKNEIARLQVPDGLPDHKPDSLYDWLCCLHLEEYILRLNRQNYKQLIDIINIAWEDLEEIGMTRLGHQKRFMLGVKRLVDIEKGLHPSHQLTRMQSASRRSMKSNIARCNSMENSDYQNK